MKDPFDGVQRIVLQGGNWAAARHMAFSFGDKECAPRRFLHLLEQARRWPTPSSRKKEDRPALQASLGFTRQGLERAKVPSHVLACFALKAPAFHAGATLRAARHLGAVGADGPAHWGPGYAHGWLDGVISFHAADAAALEKAVSDVKQAAAEAGVSACELERADRLPPHPAYRNAHQDETPDRPEDSPPDGQKDGPAMWVHFGYRDGLSRVGIKGWTEEAALQACHPVSQHAAGEFVLGHLQNSGGNPWISGPGRRVWTAPVRKFFRNGSFGVLHQIEQDVETFETFVKTKAAEHKMDADELKAKLCGRYPNGHRIGLPVAPATATAAAAQTERERDFDYHDDKAGLHCPFGAHMRRMNPREAETGAPGAPTLAHAGRARPLLRRGLPYGPAAWADPPDPKAQRGLMAQFFCTSIEDQFEHLVGEWAERVPLGSADRGGARDPLFGAHEPSDGPFEIPRPGGERHSLMLRGLQAFTQTRGVAYLFYPGKQTLLGIANSEPWLEIDESLP